MEILTGLGLAVPAGLNAYIPLLAVALAQRFDVLQLNGGLALLGEWWAIAIIAVLLLVEVLADKIPAVDHVNDLIQTVVRSAAGAVLAVGASGQTGEQYPAFMVLGGIVLAGGVHAAKAAARPVVNATTGGLGAPVVSAAEDAASLGVSVLAIVAPAAAAVVIALAAWGLWRLWHRPRRRGAKPPPSR